MDISDGLIVDMKKLIEKKNLGFCRFKSLPLSSNLKKLVFKKRFHMFRHLFNGDDYQIIFTAKNKYRKNIIKSSQKWESKNY